MPAQSLPPRRRGAGIQGDSAFASGYAFWIPGLALLARNDGPPFIHHLYCAGLLGVSGLALWTPALVARWVWYRMDYKLHSLPLAGIIFSISQEGVLS